VTYDAPKANEEPQGFYEGENTSDADLGIG